MTENKASVAIFETHQQAEDAVKELERAGFDMKTLSIIGKGFHTEENVVGYYSVGDRMKLWGKTGAFWGGLWGMLFGSAFFFIPGVGPLVFAGPIVSWMIGALEGAAVVGGLGALGAALVDAQDGGGSRHQRGQCTAHLACSWAQAAPGENFQTQPRSCVHRKTGGHRGPVPESARACPGSVRR